jgi:hypothetical protein
MPRVLDLEATFARYAKFSGRERLREKHDAVAAEEQNRLQRRIARKCVLANCSLTHEAIELARLAERLAERLADFSNEFDAASVAAELRAAGLDPNATDADGCPEADTEPTFSSYFDRLQQAVVLANLLEEFLCESPISELRTEWATTCGPVYLNVRTSNADATPSNDCV